MAAPITTRLMRDLLSHTGAIAVAAATVACRTDGYCSRINDLKANLPETEVVPALGRY